jgi:hypothetical protein
VSLKTELTDIFQATSRLGMYSFFILYPLHFILYPSHFILFKPASIQSIGEVFFGNELVNFYRANCIKYIILEAETGYDIYQDRERCH